METRNTKTAADLPKTMPGEAPKGLAKIEKLIETIEEGRETSECRNSSRILPPSEVLWDLVAAMGCAYGGVLTSGHPLIMVMAAGVVPLAVHALRLSAAVFLRFEAGRIFQHLFH